MLRWILPSALFVALAGLVSGCDSSGPALDAESELPQDTSYTPVPIAGTIGFLQSDWTGSSRTWYWKYVDLETGDVRIRSTLNGVVRNGGQWGGGAFPERVAESPDGTRLAIATDECHGCTTYRGGLYVADIDTQSHVLITAGENYHSIQWSPDNQSLLFSGLIGHIAQDDSLVGEPTCVLCLSDDTSSPRSTSALVWGANSETVRFAVRPGSPSGSPPPSFHVYEVDLRTPQSPRRLTQLPIQGIDASIGPKGHHVVARTRSADTSPYELVTLETGESQPLTLAVDEGNEARVHDIVWNPDGRYMLVHYSEAPAGFPGNVISNHVGFFDTQDPELRWQPLENIQPDTFYGDASISMFKVRQPAS